MLLSDMHFLRWKYLSGRAQYSEGLRYSGQYCNWSIILHITAVTGHEDGNNVSTLKSEGSFDCTSVADIKHCGMVSF